MDAARTEHSPPAIKRFAADAFQDNRRRLHPPQLSGPFVDESFDAGADAKDLAAERHQFGVEEETSVRKSDVEGGKDLFIGFHSHQIARLKTEIVPFDLGNGTPPVMAWVRLYSQRAERPHLSLKASVP